ncbi:hypothetical protein D3C80_2135860 [compost metagenome]
MDRGDQADDAESDDADALDDAQRTGFEAQGVFEIKRAAHDGNATEKGEQKE